MPFTSRSLVIVGLIAWSMACEVAWSWEGSADRRFALEFETGAIWQSRNQIQIPDSAEGTRFDLRDLQDKSPGIHRRVELTWNVNQHHSLRFVYAPIGFSGSGNSSPRFALPEERSFPAARWIRNIHSIPID